MDAAKSPTLGTGVAPQKSLGTDQKFGLTGEPLYGGQGMTSKLNNNLIHMDMHSEATGHWGLATHAKGVCDHVRKLHQATPLPTQESDQATGDLNLTTIYTWEGLNPPWLATSGAAVSGKDWDQLRKENKCRRCKFKATRDYAVQWTAYEGIGTPIAPTDHALQPPHCNSMCPVGQALQHPVASLLNKWAQLGCLTKTGRPWTKEKKWEAVEWSPHCSALTPDTIVHFAAEEAEKVRTNQAQIVQWENIMDHPPKELKISPITTIPH
jgi:hypothetical protein